MDDSVNRIEQVKALKNGKGIQCLLNNAYKIIGNPIFIFDIDYKLLAYSENAVTDDPFWNETIINGRLGNGIKKLIRDECFLDDFANAKTIALLTNEKLKYDRLVGKVFNRDGIMVACVDAIACNKPFKGEDYAIFEEISKLLSREISRNKFYQTYGILFQENLLRELIEGRIDDRRAYTAQVADIDKDFKPCLHMAVADISKCNAKYNKLVRFRNLFKRKQPEFRYLIYNNYIIIIFSTDQTQFDVKIELNKLYRIVMRKRIFLGISNSFDNLFELQKHYYEALDALTAGLKNNSNQISLFAEIKDHL